MRGYITVKFLMTVQWSASSGVAEDAFFDVEYVGGWSISAEWLSWSRKWNVRVHVSIHRAQKICIAQKITCSSGICNLWRHFRCCQLEIGLYLLLWQLVSNTE